ncbi:MAG: phosphoribosylanthranilate isomerase [Akkermansiaceae bacterium]|jgi:phosphoribosylanthranilate isomerase|nr:phosphoribosylanthranilate isomerase [Akkermansiaceae bacterium]
MLPPVTADFLHPSSCSLKICGVTRETDAIQLAELGVHALGANFWPRSKRFLDPAHAGFLKDLAGRIYRVGVFVNAGTHQPRELFELGLIDAVQLHGDEPDSDLLALAASGIPLIRSATLENARVPAGNAALLLDAHAPGVYGGTGQTIDWSAAARFVQENPALPVILAGGIVPENAAIAVRTVRPCAIDIASGAESAPGIKDFDKVRALLAALEG